MAGIGRRSIRLSTHDYTTGAYFVTICARERRCLFGRVFQDRVSLSPLGELVTETWQWLAERYAHVELDEWILMPNHLHGIVILSETGRGGSRAAPTSLRRKPLGQLIGAFKTVSTKRINLHRDTPGVATWQRGYYEHAVRTDAQMERARSYILTNPLRWCLDEENPSRHRQALKASR